MKILREMGTKISLSVILRGCMIVLSKSKDQEGIQLNYLEHVRRRAAFARNILINPTVGKKKGVGGVTYSTPEATSLDFCFCHYNYWMQTENWWKDHKGQQTFTVYSMEQRKGSCRQRSITATEIILRVKPRLWQPPVFTATNQKTFSLIVLNGVCYTVTAFLLYTSQEQLILKENYSTLVKSQVH